MTRCTQQWRFCEPRGHLSSVPSFRMQSSGPDRRTRMRITPPYCCTSVRSFIRHVWKDNTLHRRLLCDGSATTCMHCCTPYYAVHIHIILPTFVKMHPLSCSWLAMNALPWRATRVFRCRALMKSRLCSSSSRSWGDHDRVHKTSKNTTQKFSSFFNLHVRNYMIRHDISGEGTSTNHEGR